MDYREEIDIHLADEGISYDRFIKDCLCFAKENSEERFNSTLKLIKKLIPETTDTNIMSHIKEFIDNPQLLRISSIDIYNFVDYLLILYVENDKEFIRLSYRIFINSVIITVFSAPEGILNLKPNFRDGNILRSILPYISEWICGLVGKDNPYRVESNWETEEYEFKWKPLIDKEDDKL